MFPCSKGTNAEKSAINTKLIANNPSIHLSLDNSFDEWREVCLLFTHPLVLATSYLGQIPDIKPTIMGHVRSLKLIFNLIFPFLVFAKKREGSCVCGSKCVQKSRQTQQTTKSDRLAANEVTFASYNIYARGEGNASPNCLLCMWGGMIHCSPLLPLSCALPTSLPSPSSRGQT